MTGIFKYLHDLVSAKDTGAWRTIKAFTGKWITHDSEVPLGNCFFEIQFNVILQEYRLIQTGFKPETHSVRENALSEKARLNNELINKQSMSTDKINVIAQELPTIKTTISLLNSMINSGEQHTTTSREQVLDGLEAIETIKDLLK